MSYKTKFTPRSFFGLTIAATLAFGSLATVPAQAVTECPDGWTLDFWVTPMACDYFIQGDDTFTVPEGVTSIAAFAVGGGGAGGAGGFDGEDPKAGGGGGGAEISQTLLTVTPGEVLTADIGHGGSRGNVDPVTGLAGNGGDGGTTTLTTATNTVLITAVGGKGGKSGTNGGNGGASGNSNPALINAGGLGFNDLGASSGGGGGGQWSPGTNGALNVAGSGGVAEDIVGENGLPMVITDDNYVFRDTTLYPSFYSIVVRMAGSGLGGGGGTFQNDGDGCEDNQAGRGSVATQNDLSGQEGQGSCASIYGYNWIASLSYTDGYPGQGGSGGVGYRQNSSDPIEYKGTIGVPGIIWLRIFLDDAPPPPPPTEPTFLDSDSDTLNFGGEITVTTDADPNSGYWVGIWVNGEFGGPFPEFESEMNFEWENFSVIAACESQDLVFGLFDPSYSPFDEELDLADAIDSFNLTYGPDPDCDSGGGPAGTGGNELGKTGLGLTSPGGVAAMAILAVLAGGALYVRRRRRTL